MNAKTLAALILMAAVWIASAGLGCGGGEFTPAHPGDAAASGGQAGAAGAQAGSGGSSDGGQAGQPQAGSSGSQAGSGAGPIDAIEGFPQPLGIECTKCLPEEFTNGGLCEDRYIACLNDHSNKGCNGALNCVAACLKGTALFQDCLVGTCWAVYPTEVMDRINDVYSCVCCASQCNGSCSSFCASVTGVYGPAKCTGYDAGTP